MLKNKRLCWNIGIIGLLLTFVLCRFAFFGLHNMIQWPNTLAVIGVITLAVGYFTDMRRLAIAVPSGYIAGFALAMIFNTDGVDQGSGRTNNAWLIWIAVYIVIIVGGLAWELVDRHQKKQTGKRDSQ